MALKKDVLIEQKGMTYTIHREIFISSTFTAEPIAEGLMFWGNFFHQQPKITFGPYNQVLQQLLNPESELLNITHGIGVILLRWQDLSVNDHSFLATLERNSKDFFTALENVKSPLLVLVCPASEYIHQNKPVMDYCDLLNRHLHFLAEKMSSLHVFCPSEIFGIYPVAEIHDPLLEKEAHIPYSQRAFTAFATIIYRKFQSLYRSPYKVIILDCDNTLWQGACGEVGAMGVNISTPYLALQDFMLTQHKKGMILCLNSKNNQEDVDAVFELNPNMHLKKSHIAAEKVNWESKADNIKSLALELNLDVDSFIFIDDDRVQCEEVRTQCPQVLTLLLPDDFQAIPEFLTHTWAFDSQSTGTGVDRSRYYKENQKRLQFQRKLQPEDLSLDLLHFVESLELDINIQLIEDEHITRASELSIRTNQFNLMTQRYQENEMSNRRRTKSQLGWIVRVSDRFGDYGYVGLMLANLTEDNLEVTDFMLSCRAMGRGVEHAMVNHLGDFSSDNNLQSVTLFYRATSKNRPALIFLRSTSFSPSIDTESMKSGSVCYWRGSSKQASSLRFRPIGKTNHSRKTDRSGEDTPKKFSSPAIIIQDKYLAIANSLVRVEDIYEQVKLQVKNRSGIRQHLSHYVAPRTEAETAICQIWREVLGLEQVGITDDFFRVGGNSIQAIRVSHRMNKVLGCEVRVADIFKYKTISLLLAHSLGHTQLVIPKTASNTAVLSFAQERLWFIEQYEEGTNAYHIPEVLELDRKTDIGGIKYALQQIVSRHEVLRSTIGQSNDQGGIQQVHNKPLPIEEVSMPESDDYEALIQEDIHRPFDLKTEYPIRVKFYKILSARSKNTINKSILLINIHHIASDGWSSDIFQRELFAYYEAYVDKDTKFSLPALEIQYKDYALWQRTYLTGEILVQQLSYWKGKLSGYQNLELPTDYARPNQTDYRGAQQEFTLTRKTSEKLRALAKDFGTTLHSVLLSSINILLGKYTGQQDIVIGSPIANRHHRQTEGLIGFFVNTQVNRTILGRSQSYEDLIHQVHQDQIAAQIHQDLPFEKLVEEMGVERDASRHPIFQVMFVLQDFENDKTIDKQRNYLKPFQGSSAYEVEKFDLSIFIEDSGEELKGEIGYATSLFHKDTIDRLIDHYTYLLDQLVESPQEVYSKLSLLRPQDYNQIVYEWNKTDKDYPKDKTIYQLFEEQVKRTPDNIALVFEGEQLTYAELNEKSNQLARQIRARYKKKTKHDLEPDTLIALCLDRSLEMVIGILAVLKAGGAYVPIDPSYPQERLDYILEDTKAELVLNQKHLSKNSNVKLPKGKVLYIDLTEELYQVENTSNLGPHSVSTDLGYVIYTSGTTGKPKGVMVEQRGVINLITDLQEKYEIESSERFLLFANYVFDASCEQLLLSLFSGSTLFVIDNRTILDNNGFTDFVIKNRITHLHSTPSYLSTIEPWKINTLRRVVFGAEYLSEDLFRKYRKVISKVINEYGPTETTITSHVSINSYLLNNAGIQNIKSYVLDPNGTSVPIGVAGELYISGAGLARGYLHNEELTNERFIPNPFTTEGDKEKGYTRLYKTGDLVRWLPDGNLEYIGRNDDQVKIRGYRIELGEIEHALTQVQGVKQSCVLARERGTATGSNKYLVGYYIVDSEGETLTKTTILEKLSAMLPDYMVPSALVEMESFPLTINGKLDKRALPEPDFSSANEDYVAPTTETETAICHIWQEVLGLEQVGVTDDFFRIGGDSILSIQVSSRIRRLGFNCQVKDIFSCKTIAKLSKHLSRNKTIEAVQSEQGVLSGVFGLLPIQLWFAERVEGGAIKAPHHWNQSFLVKVRELDQNKLRATIGKLVDYHDVLRVKYLRKEAWEQVYRSSITLPQLKTMDVSRLSASEIQQKLTEWQSGFDLDQGPLFQMGYLYGYKDGSARLFFALHHMIVDGVSWRILVEDVKDLYTGKSLPEKGSSYRQWIKCVKDYPGQHPEEVSYWEAQLEGIPSYDIPKDNLTRPTIDSLELNKTVTRSLLQNAPKAYHTEINDLLLTALAYALKDINGNDTQGITLEGHGREAIDPAIDHSRTLGWFTTMFPVRLELQNTLKESIQSIKESLRNKPNKGIGFGAFAVDDTTSFALKELTPIGFNYLGQFDTQQEDWQFVVEDSGMSVHPTNTDYNLIDINGMVSDGKLRFRIATQLGEVTTRQLCDSLKFHLKAVIRHCLETIEKEGSSYTPSDFPSVRLSQYLLGGIQSKARANQNEIAHIYPASSLQQGFIYHALSQTQDDAYRVQTLYDYNQSLDVEKYINAWQACIAQYPILRTAFNWEEEIIQVIYKHGKLEYEVHDISELSTQQARDTQIETIRNEDRKRSFYLTQPTLLRLHIIKQSEDFYTILKTEHHSISDGWSGPILLKSLHQYYQALTANSRITKNEDTAYLQAQEYISKNKDTIADYWHKTLAEVDTANDISTLLSEPLDVSSYREVDQPASTFLEIEGKVYNQLKSFSQREGVTINVILQFIWHKLLQVYSSNSRSIVGSTVSGRDLPVEGIEESVGMYINTLPLVINWDNENTIKAQLHQIQEQITALNSHSYVDLAKLQKEGERLFHSLFVFENYPISKWDVEDSLNFNNRSYFDGVDYPLSLIVHEQNGALNINLKYDAKYLSEEKANQHIVTLESILEQVILAPTQLHGKISLLRPRDYNQIVYEWNNTDKDYPKDKTIYQLFEEQVKKTPDNIALVFEGRRLTYEELNEKSNQLARHIRSQFKKRTKKDLKPDSLVALCLDRSLEMVIGILGVLKAGGAYVPIDPSYPQERLDYILEDTKAELVLSQKRLSKNSNVKLPKGKVIYIDLSEELYQVVNTSNLKAFSRASDLVYVIYTSGTTGKPKGVMLEHLSIYNRVLHIISYSNITSSDFHLFKTNYAFDASFFEIFTNLCIGARLQMTKYRFDLDELVHLLSTENFTSLHLVPSQYELVSSTINSIDLHKIYFSGEALTTGILSNINNNIEIYNYYGPTELGEITVSNPKSPTDASLIGKVFPNCRQYVLDPNRTPVPIGVIGELYIAGAGLARGYLNKKDLTAERFIFNPFATDKDKAKGYTRLYKTGDLVRLLPDGNLEFIGRNDDQVKIRGYRIELGEIEHALTQVPGVKQSCVLVRERGTATGSNKYLVGYYVLDGEGETLTKTNILEKLSTMLPDYMVPSVLVAMEAFPLTINGKLDKRALPDQEFNSAKEYVAPRTEAETAICQIWREVLGLEQVGITDDFFRVGGNSIQAIRVSHRMNKVLGCEVRVADIFKYKTISLLLAHSLGHTQLVIPKTASNTAVLSFAQERLWFIEQYEEGTNAYHIPEVLELDRKTDIGGIKYALQQIVSRHEVLRSTIGQSNDQGGIQQVHNKPLPIEEVSMPESDDYEALIQEDIHRPFDLKTEYPIRVKFYKILSARSKNTINKSILLINIHHIASDGWSSDIFQRELFAYYEAYVDKDTKFSLPALEIQYKDYALWQRTYLTGEILVQQLSYWKGKLSGYQNLELPTDYARPNQTDYRGAQQEFTLTRKTSEKLRALAKDFGTTLHSVLLSSINILLGKYTGQQDIVIGSPIANRHHRQTEGLIGFFVNTQVNRTILGRSQSYEDLIHQVHQDQIAAQIHQDLPFEKLVEEMGVERDASRHPIFQVMFVLQDFENDKTIDKQRNYLKPFQGSSAYEVEKFDLSIFIEDSGEELKGEIGYATSLFHKDTIDRLIDHYTYLLDQLVESPQEVYSKLSLLRPQDYNQIVYEWNKTDKDYPKDKTIYQLFEEQVKRTPDNIALVFEGEQLTYAELNEKSNQLARQIRARYKKKTKHDLEPDTLIALCLDRSLEMVIGILAVLKAGGAYVPIDPSYPQERLDYILEDTKAELVLNQKHLSKNSNVKLPKGKVLYIDLTEELYQVENTSNLGPHSVSTDLGYVIYTSGTTGKPKGVMVEQRGVINLITDLQEKYEIESSERFLLFANYVFDASCEQLLLSLFSGSTLFVIDNRTILDNNGFTDFVIKNRITQIDSTPSYLSSIDPSNFNTVKRVVFGGEFLSKKLFDTYKNNIPAVINTYGPTETTITSHASINSYLLNNVGIQNIKSYVLDPNRTPVPIGVIGELYIGGAGLTRGYLHNEELTKERFISNPFATAEDKAKGYTRLYKTGDLVRWLPDGNIEYIGRNDDQVKIRGYRIELGEIEHALTQVPGVKQSCVLARERGTATGSNKYLVGYYVLDGEGNTLTQTIILEKLSEVLPDYMVPSSLVKMDSFPLTINGKLDKRALPKPDFSSASEDYVAPRTEAETAICQIWQEVLGLEQVGITDDFFRVGGNSIQAIQVSNRIGKILGRTVKVADVFKFKTIDRILAIKGQYSELVKPFQLNYNADLVDMIFISPGRADSEMYQHLAEILTAKYNCIGIDNFNIHNKKKINSLNTLANYYLSEFEQKYALKEPINLLGWSLGGQIALEMAAILEMKGYKSVNVILLDTFIPDASTVQIIDQREEEDSIVQERNAMLKKYEAVYVEKVFSALSTERDLANSSISSRLHYTNVVLFKATNNQSINGNKQRNSNSEEENINNSTSNNVDLVATHLEVINLDCHHYNILETNSESISDYLLRIHVTNKLNGRQTVNPT